MPRARYINTNSLSGGRFSPLGFDIVLNETLKILIGTILFFLQYYLYGIIFEYGLDSMMDFAVFFIMNFIATIAAYLISYAIIILVFFKKYQSRGFIRLNDGGNERDRVPKIFYIFTVSVLNSIGCAIMAVTFLMELSEMNIGLFLLYWFGYKIIIAIASVFIARGMNNHAVFSMIFIVVITSVLFLGLMIWGEIYGEK